MMGLLSQMTSIAALLLMTSLFAMHQIQAWKVLKTSRPTFKCKKPDPRFSEALANTSFNIIDVDAKTVNVHVETNILFNVTTDIKISLTGLVHLLEWGLDFDIPSQETNLCNMDGMCPVSQGFLNKTFTVDKFEGFWTGIYDIKLTAGTAKYRTCINVKVTVDAN